MSRRGYIDDIERNPLALGYIVMPPGHGKTHLHQSIHQLYEADSLVGYRSTQELSELRDRSKITGNWDVYDSVWTQMVSERLTGFASVIMVPARSVGETGGWEYLGTLALQPEAWEMNLKTRGVTSDKYQECWHQACQEGEVLPSNEALAERVYQICRSYSSFDVVSRRRGYLSQLNDMLRSGIGHETYLRGSSATPQLKTLLCPCCFVLTKERGEHNCPVVNTGQFMTLPIKCPWCSSGFYSPEGLYKHAVRHTGHCPVCGKDEPSSQQLIAHLEVHHIEYTCPNCGKTFDKTGSLRNHIRNSSHCKSILPDLPSSITQD